MYNQIYKSIKSQGNYSRKQENDFSNSIESNYKKYLNRSNQFVQKIIIENHPSTEDLMYILENFLTENNYPIDFITDNEPNKISITFNDEIVAFNFTKKLNLEKIKNPIYAVTKITLTLVKNENFTSPKIIKKKKGLSIDTIQRLYKGDNLFNSNKTIKTKSKFGNITKLILSNSNSVRGKNK